MNEAIRTKFNKPKIIYSNPGTEIYEYKVFEKQLVEIEKTLPDGKKKKETIETDVLITKKENTNEKIQSYLPTVDYKRKIAEGDVNVYGDGSNAVYGDTTELPNNTVDLVSLLTGISQLSEEQVQALSQFFNTQSTEGSETVQRNEEVTTKSEQTSSESNTDSTTSTEQSEGGE